MIIAHIGLPLLHRPTTRCRILGVRRLHTSYADFHARSALQHDREIIAWRAIVNAGISGSDVRDIMLEAVEARFGGMRAPVPVEMLSDNGSAYTARESRIFARQLGLKPCFTAVRSPTASPRPSCIPSSAITSASDCYPMHPPR